MAQRLYVGNIPFRATEDELREMFGTHGEVRDVSIITDRETGRSRGFCFVEMENAEAAIAALNEKEYGGRTLRVNIAHERRPGRA